MSLLKRFINWFTAPVIWDDTGETIYPEPEWCKSKPINDEYEEWCIRNMQEDFKRKWSKHDVSPCRGYSRPREDKAVGWGYCPKCRKKYHEGGYRSTIQINNCQC